MVWLPHNHERVEQMGLALLGLLKGWMGPKIPSPSAVMHQTAPLFGTSLYNNYGTTVK